jgi:hypothetical protein
MADAIREILMAVTFPYGLDRRVADLSGVEHNVSLWRGSRDEPGVGAPRRADIDARRSVPALFAPPPACGDQLPPPP